MENGPLPDTPLVMVTTTGFFDRYLRDDGDAAGRIREAVDAEVGFKRGRRGSADPRRAHTE